MTDREKFHKTFGKMHASPDTFKEVMNMANGNIRPARAKRIISKAAVAALACILVLGSGTAAYAMDLGGIQRTVQIWIYGDQTDAIFNADDGTYTFTYKDADGNDVQRSGGGIAYEADGTERPLTEDELLEEINSPEVSYEEDGSVWVYYFDQKMEITDKFENDICYIQLKHGSEILYMTIKYQNGYATSPYRYMRPSEFN